MTPKELGLKYLELYPPDKNGWNSPVLIEELVKVCGDFKTKNGCS